MRLFWKLIPLSDLILSAGVPCHYKMCLKAGDGVPSSGSGLQGVFHNRHLLPQLWWVALALVYFWQWSNAANLPTLTILETQPLPSIPRRFHSCSLLDCSTFHICLCVGIVVQDKCLLKRRVRAAVLWEWDVTCKRLDDQHGHLSVVLNKCTYPGSAGSFCWINSAWTYITRPKTRNKYMSLVID